MRLTQDRLTFFGVVLAMVVVAVAYIRLGQAIAPDESRAEIEPVPAGVTAAELPGVPIPTRAEP